jgi:hypothetical protein
MFFLKILQQFPSYDFLAHTKRELLNLAESVFCQKTGEKSSKK